jgi:hypothetical protein
MIAQQILSLMKVVERRKHPASYECREKALACVYIAFTLTIKARDHKGHLRSRLIQRDDGKEERNRVIIPKNSQRSLRKAHWILRGRPGGSQRYERGWIQKIDAL